MTPHLTPYPLRDAEVMRLLGEGLSTATVCRALGINLNTIRRIVRRSRRATATTEMAYGKATNKHAAGAEVAAPEEGEGL